MRSLRFLWSYLLTPMRQHITVHTLANMVTDLDTHWMCGKNQVGQINSHTSSPDLVGKIKKIQIISKIALMHLITIDTGRLIGIGHHMISPVL